MIDLYQKYLQEASLSFSEFTNNCSKSIATITTIVNKDINNNSIKKIDNWFNPNRFNKYLYDIESLLQ